MLQLCGFYPYTLSTKFRSQSSLVFGFLCNLIKPSAHIPLTEIRKQRSRNEPRFCQRISFSSKDCWRELLSRPSPQVPGCVVSECPRCRSCKGTCAEACRANLQTFSRRRGTHHRAQHGRFGCTILVIAKSARETLIKLSAFHNRSS